MYVVTTNKGVNSQHLGTSGLPVAIFKMLAAENDDKPKTGMSIFRPLFIIDLLFLELDTGRWFWGWQNPMKELSYN